MEPIKDFELEVLGDMADLTKRDLINKIDKLQQKLYYFIKTQRKEHELLDESLLDAFNVIGEMSQDNTKLKKAKDITEGSALDILKTVGEMSEEKKQIVSEKIQVEQSAMDIATALGEMSADQRKISNEKKLLESNVSDILKLVNNLNIQKKNLIIEKETIEKSAMSIARSVGEISEEKSEAIKEKEKIKKLAMTIANSAGKVFLNEETIEYQKKKLREMAEKIKTTEKAFTDVLNKLFPHQISLDLLLGKQEFVSQEVSVMHLKIRKFRDKLVKNNAFKLARDLKAFFSDLHALIIKFDGWIVRYREEGLIVLFGVPAVNKTHPLDATLCADNIIKFCKKRNDFSVHIGISTDTVVLGDFGSNLRPQYDSIGQADLVADGLLEVAIDSNANVIIDDTTYSRIKYFFECKDILGNRSSILIDHKKTKVNSLINIYKTPNNPYRINKNSKIYKTYYYIYDEVIERKEKLLTTINTTKYERKDGSLGQGDALAYYALALAEYTKLKINKERLMIACFLLNIGKAYIRADILTKAGLTLNDKKVVTNIVGYSVKILEKLGKFSDVKAVWYELRKELPSITANEAKILKIVSVWEGIAFPKLYKESQPHATGKIGILKNALSGELVKKFIELIEVSG